MVDAVQPRTPAAEGSPGELAGKPLRIGKLRAFGRRLLRAVQESRRRRAAIIVRQYAHLVPPRCGGDRDV
jgi:hypothetical protein